MKIRHLLLGLLCANASIFAQEVNYYFEQFTNSYNDLANPISISNGEIWDDPNYIVDIGFDYKLFNNSSSQVLFNQDLGGGVSNKFFDKAIIATAADIADRAYNTDGNQSLSPISYQLDGAEGSRIFKLEWKNAGFLDDDSGDYYMNLQLWIYESSDMIEIHYGPSSIESSLYNWQGDFCGIFEFDDSEETTEGYIIEEIVGNYEFDFVIVDDLFSPSTFSNIPENGTVFRFYPEYAVGMNEVKAVINTYPNPVNNILHIDNSEQNELHYQIVTIDGRVLHESTSNEAKIQIDMSNYQAGIYLINALNDGKPFKKSFVKQ